MIADAGGGTLLTVMGEGFVGDARCLFTDGKTSKARVLSQSRLTCEAPGTSFGGCQAGRLQVKVGNATTTSNVVLTYVGTPTILGLEPRQGLHNESETVTVSGYGFVNSSRLQCAFRFPDNRDADVSRTATFVSPTMIMCDQPAMPGPEPLAHLEVSLDGQVCPLNAGHYLRLSHAKVRDRVSA